MIEHHEDRDDFDLGVFALWPSAPARRQERERREAFARRKAARLLREHNDFRRRIGLPPVDALPTTEGHNA